MSLTARDVMVTKVYSVRHEMPLEELERVLIEEGIGGAPVLKEGRLVGIVSRSDLVRSRVVERSRAEALSAYYQDAFDDDAEREEVDDTVDDAVAARLADLLVEDVMIRDLICVGPDASLQEVASTMLGRRIHRLLVREGDELLGVISSTDLVRLVADGRLESRKEARSGG